MPETCGNCGEPLKLGMLSSNQALTSPQIRVINLAGTEVSEACDRCGGDLLQDAKRTLKLEIAQLREAVSAFLPHIPIASIHSPEGWQYDVIDVITAQSVTGTGIFSDVASAFTDLFGSQSGTYNAKLREGENLCKRSLRAQALELGANAILAADVDYAEVGGQRAMLMVCMTGTAVRVRAAEGLGPEFGSQTERAAGQTRRIREIDSALEKATG